MDEEEGLKDPAAGTGTPKDRKESCTRSSVLVSGRDTESTSTPLVKGGHSPYFSGALLRGRNLVCRRSRGLKVGEGSHLSSVDVVEVGASAPVLDPGFGVPPLARAGWTSERTTNAYRTWRSETLEEANPRRNKIFESEIGLWGRATQLEGR